MGTIAELAVKHRVLLHGFRVYDPVVEGAKVDFYVEDPDGGVPRKVQVKCVNASGTHGLPLVQIRCADGTKGSTKGTRFRRYRDDEFDFIVGYDLVTDTCYVWTREEVAHLKASVTVTLDAAEQWGKFRSVAQPG